MSSSRRRSADRRCRHQEPVAAGGRLGQPLAGAQERRAGPLGRGARPRVDLAGDDDPAHRPAVRVEAGPQDGRERVGAGPEQALELVALGELEVGQPGLGRIRASSSAASVRSQAVAAGASRRERTTSPKSTMPFTPQANWWQD